MKKIILGLLTVCLGFSLAACGDDTNEDTTTKTHTVSFDSNGGSAVASVKVEDGKSVAKPTDPTKANFTFGEWQLGGTTYSFSAVVTEDITLKATWNAVPVVPTTTFTVTFDVDGVTTTQNVNEGSKATQPANPTKEGYTFVEWQLNNNTFNFDTIITADITLVAVFNSNEDAGNGTVEVSFEVDGKVEVITVEVGSSIKQPSDPYKDGYTFVEWQLNGKSFSFEEPITESITLVAVFTQNEGEPTIEEALNILNGEITGYTSVSIMDMGAIMGLPENLLLIEDTTEIDGNKAHLTSITRSCLVFDEETGEPKVDENGDLIINTNSGADGDGSVIFEVIGFEESYVVANEDTTFNVFTNDGEGNFDLTENVVDTDGSLSFLFESDELNLQAEDFSYVEIENGMSVYQTTISETTPEGNLEVIIQIDLNYGLNNMRLTQVASIGGLTIKGFTSNFNNTNVTLPEVN